MVGFDHVFDFDYYNLVRLMFCLGFFGVGFGRGWHVVHLPVAADEDDFLVVFGIGCAWELGVDAGRPVGPTGDEFAYFFFQRLEEALGGFGFFEFFSQLFGDFTMFEAGCLTPLFRSFASLLFSGLSGGEVGIPERSEVVWYNVLLVGRVDFPIARKGWLGPWIVQQTICWYPIVSISRGRS